MRIKLIIFLLIICLVFLFGFAQAQTGEDNTSQNVQNMSLNMSQQGNMSVNVTESMTGNMTGNMSNVPFMLQSIEGVRNNDTTGERWFTYINGSQANEDFGLNNVSNGTNLSFWYTNSTDGRAAIENASYVANVTVSIIPPAGNQTSNQTNGNQTGGNQTDVNQTGGNQIGQNLTVLYNNTVNLTQGNFTFMPENLTQAYQVNNLTDLGALNATGLAFNASLMENMTENMTQDQNAQEQNWNIVGSCEELTFSDVTPETFECMKSQLQEYGINVPPGNEGELSGQGITANFEWDGRSELTIRITEKPFFVSCSTAEQELAKFVEECKGS